MRFRLVLTLAALGLAALALPGPATATTVTVTTTGDPAGAGSCPADPCSLRQALAFASPNDTVSLPAGNYQMTQGLLNIIKDLTVAGAGAQTTTIVGTGSGSVVNAVAPTKQTIQDLTITGGNTNTPGNIDGGGIVSNGSDLELDRAVVTGNRSTLQFGFSAGRGGGISTNGDGPNHEGLVLDHSVVANNVADGYAGGIDTNGTPVTIRDSQITNNIAGTAAIAGSTPAISTNSSTLSIVRSSITDNHAIVPPNMTPNGYAAISTNGTTVLVSRSTIAGNSIDLGNNGGLADGALRVTDATLIVNSTISGNSSGGRGGGVHGLGATVGILNSTIADNTSGFGGGIGGTAVQYSIENSIIANNTATDPTAANCDPGHSNVYDSFGNNLESANTCSFNFIGDLINTNPLLGPLTDNGGTTLTRALQVGSLAIAAGYRPDCPSTDQRGVSRPADTCDIGACECTFAAPPPSSSPSTPAAPPGSIPVVTIQTATAKVKKGTADIALLCRGAQCKGNLVLKTTGKIGKSSVAAVESKKKKKKKKAVELGQGKFTIEAGKSSVLKIRLSGKAMKLLAKQKKLKSIATATLASPGTANATRNLTLKPAKKTTRKKRHTRR